MRQAKPLDSHTQPLKYSWLLMHLKETEDKNSVKYTDEMKTMSVEKCISFRMLKIHSNKYKQVTKYIDRKVILGMGKVL